MFTVYKYININIEEKEENKKTWMLRDIVIWLPTLLFVLNVMSL